MGSRKAKIIQPIETITSWEVICPNCEETVYVTIPEEADLMRCDCDNCGSRFIVNIKEFIKNTQND